MPRPDTAPDLELRSLQQQIHDVLLRRILRGELGPGERISPPEIAGSLGVSITPVRDAVNQMAAEGLVTVLPRKGTIVSPIASRDVEELYEIRLMLEPRAAELAAEHASKPEIERMTELADRLEDDTESIDSQSLDLEMYLAEIATDAEFHAAVVRAAGIRRLTVLYEGLRTHVLIARTIFPRLYRGQPHRRGEHRRIVDAIAARDGAAAREATVTHLRRALTDTMRHIERSAGAGRGTPDTER
jgi:DNA-binding GntR family transcriptional regulator